jgi:hypothetical protein
MIKDFLKLGGGLTPFGGQLDKIGFAAYLTGWKEEPAPARIAQFIGSGMLKNFKGLRRVRAGQCEFRIYARQKVDCTKMSSRSRMSKSSANVFALTVSPAKASARAARYCTFHACRKPERRLSPLSRFPGVANSTARRKKSGCF